MHPLLLALANIRIHERLKEAAHARLIRTLRRRAERHR
jgi:hypothetical protein